MSTFDPQKFEAFCAQLRVDTKEFGRRPLKWLGSQRYFVEQIADGLRNGIHTFIILKGRQMGISTVSLALDLYWMFKHEGLQGAIVTDTDENREIFRSMVTQYIESMPPAAKPGTDKHNRVQLILKNNSRLVYMVAGTRKKGDLGRAKAVNFMHACCAPDTQVITADGRIKLIQDVVIGDQVLTHTGQSTRVVDVQGQANTKGTLVRVRPWLGEAVSYTREHLIPTQRGMVEAGDLLLTDWLVMPLRRITAGVTHVTLPATPLREQKGGAISKGSGVVLALDEPLGFFCGYYLAEGHLRMQTGVNRELRAAGMTFARHRNEKAYADRALEAVAHVITSRRTQDRMGSLTTVEHVGGAALAQWVFETFGRVQEKHIPDECFDFGPAFCRGLLTGVLCGDGSKTRNLANGKYPINRVTLPSIHSSIAMQARDIAAALGFGWGACSYQPAREVRNRVEHEQWRIVWTGSAAAKLRSLMGLPQDGNLKPWLEKYRIENDQVWIKIRSIDADAVDTIWDLSVEHEDHTFRTPWMATSNTECSSWGDEEGYGSLINTLAQQNPNRLYVFESTARGYDMFYETWEVAKKSKTQKAIFIGWWRNELYRKERNSLEFKTYWDGDLTSDERTWVKEVYEAYRVEISPEQIAWWRWYVTEQMKGDEMMALQEMPPTEDYAFQLSGSKFFSGERVNLHYQRAVKLEPLYFRYKFGLVFEDTEFIETNADNAEVTIWETPQPRGVYALGCDPAYGSSEWADEFAGSLLRCYADRVVQVLEIGTPDWTEQQYAWAIAHLAGWYGNCMLNLEMQGPGGAVFNELSNLRAQAGMMKKGDPRMGAFDVVGMIRDYLWRKQDSLHGSFAYQWQTNSREKIRMMSTLRSYFERDMIEINSTACLQQFRNIHRNGDSIGGEGRAKDDRVIALAIAVIAWNDWLMREMQAANRTFALENRPPEVQKEVSPVERGVMDYLKKAGIRLGTTR